MGLGVAEKSRERYNFYVQVPSYRATKDIKRREDIVEEVGRLVGYTTIPERIPVFERLTTRDGWVDRLSLLNRCLLLGAI